MIEQYTTGPNQIVASVSRPDPNPLPKLTAYQCSILENLEFPRKLKTLYKVIDMPEDSLRRELWVLKNKGIISKNDKTKKWSRVK